MKVTQVVVSFEGTIPTQPYGNVVISSSWTAQLEEGESPEEATKELMQRIRQQVIEATRPIAEAKVKGMEQALSMLPKAEQESIRAKFGVMQWLQAVVPEANFAGVVKDGEHAD